MRYRDWFNRFFLVSLVLIFFSLQLQIRADDITFVASGPVKVSLGSQFRITYTINAQGTNFKAPTFKNFNYIGGPNESSSSNMQIFQGQVYQSVQYSYTIYLQAITIGKFEINEASITVNGKVYKSNKLSIEVVAGNAGQHNQSQNQQNQPPQNNRNQQSNNTTEEATIGNKDVFVQAIASRNSVYEGEEVKITYKLYTAIPIVQYSINKVPSSKSFWSTELNDRQKQPKQYQENRDGRTYTVAEVRKVYVYPQKTGQLRIDPLKLDIVAQVKKAQQRRGGFWDSFFGRDYSNVEKTVSSNAVIINVKTLPDNAPISYTGAVGQLSVSAKIDKQNILANEALKLQVTVSGKGNLKLIDYPIINFPSSFELYDPKTIDQTKTTDAGASGSIVFEYIAIPRTEGKYTIESDGFTYFDPSKNTFVTLPIPKFDVIVGEGVGGKESVVTNVNQKEIQYVGSDIRFIETTIDDLQKGNSIFYASTIFWLLLLLPIVCFVIFILIYKKEIKKRADIAGMKNRKAGKEAHKRLQKAKKMLALNLENEFYVELSSAIWGYVADKLMIPKSNLSTESVISSMKSHELSDDIVQKAQKMLSDCEFARFAPHKASDLMNSLYEESFNLIIELDKEFKLKI